MKYDIRFYSTEFGSSLPTKAGILYMLDMPRDLTFWFDNPNGEWHKSLYKPIDIMSDKEFVEVKTFDNGYITSDDARAFFLSQLKSHTNIQDGM